jgi:hypothetical protein
MTLWIDSKDLPPEKAAEFDRAEGTLNVGGTLEEPLGPPENREAIFFVESPAKTLVTIELDERLRFYFGRRPPGGTAIYAVVDGTALVGMEQMAIECSWTLFGLAIRVTDRASGASVSSK